MLIKQKLNGRGLKETSARRVGMTQTSKKARNVPKGGQPVAPQTKAAAQIMRRS